MAVSLNANWTSKYLSEKVTVGEIKGIEKRMLMEAGSMKVYAFLYFFLVKSLVCV